MCRFTLFATIILLSCPVFAQGQWSPFVSLIDSNPPNGAAFLNEKYGFVSTSKGVYRTTDGAKTWKKTNLVASLSRGQFYYYSPSNIFFNGSLESTDSGMTWRNLIEPAEGQLYIKNGIFFDASGRVSNNHARSWKVIDTNYLSGETIAGNLDSVIAIWGGSAFGNDSTLYTTDLGRTWQYGSAGVESDFGYAIPFTGTIFRSGGDGGDAIETSYSSGQSWDTTFGPVSMQYLSDGIAGDGCVVFAQTMDTTFYSPPPGLMRSTDQGITWEWIGGPVNKDDYPLCGAASRGAVCFAMSYKRGEPVYKFVDSSLLRPVTEDMKINRSFSDTIMMSECDSIRLKMHIGFTACDYIRFQSIHIDSLASQFYRITAKTGNVIREGHPDSAQISISSVPAGTYDLRIHLGVSASDYSPADTALSVVLVVTPSPPVLEIDKRDTINFGTSVFCSAGATQEIHLANLSCHSLKVSKVLLAMDSVSRFDFTASMPTNYILKEGIGQGKITVKLAPLTAGVKNGKLVIVTSIGNDTLPIYANVLPPPKTLDYSADAFGAPICGSILGSMSFTNRSCRYMTLDSMTLPMPFTLLSVRFPVFIAPGDSVMLPVSFAPSARGAISIQAKANMSFYMPTEVEGFDTMITLSGYGGRGPSAYTLSGTTIMFDTLRLCDGSRSEHLVLMSTGCDSLFLRSVAMSGDTEFTMSESGKRAIAVGDTLSLDITLDPTSKGNKSAFITIRKDDTSYSVIQVWAPVVRALRSIASPVTSYTLPAQHTCENSDTLVSIANTSCDTVHIWGVGFQGTGFASDTKFPVMIPPFSTRTVHVITYLDTTGGVMTNTSRMSFLSDADNAAAPVTLSRSYLAPGTVHLWLGATPQKSSAGEIWYLKLKADPADLAGIRSIDFALDYNSDVLGFLPDQSSASSSDGRNFSVSSFSQLATDPDSSVALVEFEAYLTNVATSTVRISEIVLNADDTNFMGCMSLPAAPAKGPDFSYNDLCGDGRIRSLMLGEPMSFRISPNPVRNELLLSLSSKPAGDLTLEIFDALGKRIVTTALPSTSGPVPVATRDLPSGLYLLRLHSGLFTASAQFLKVE